MRNKPFKATDPDFYNAAVGDTTWGPLLAERMFARHVKERREAHGMTQAALARAMRERGLPQMSQSAIAKLEREDDAARRPIRLVEAAALADYLRSSVNDMSMRDAPISEEHRRWLEAADAKSQAFHELVLAEQRNADAQAEEKAALAAYVKKGTRSGQRRKKA